MDLDGILGETIQLYRENVVLLSLVAAVVAVPYALVKLLPARSPLVVLSLLAAGLLYIPCAAMLTGIVGAGYRLLPATLGEAIVAAGETFPSLLGAVLLEAMAAAGIVAAAAIVGVALAALLHSMAIFVLMLLIGGASLVYLRVRWTFLTQMIVLEETGMFDAFIRSGELVEGSWWRVFGTQLAVGLPLGIISLTLPAILAAALGPAVGGSVGALAALLLAFPLEIAVTTLLYFDLMGRRYGDPLQLVA